MPRILTAQFAHETNTFSKRPTGVEQFLTYRYAAGAAVFEQQRGTNSEIGGFLDVAEAEGWELVPAIAATACPSGRVTAEAYRRFAGEIVEAAVKGPWDGVLLALHGAMVTDSDEDGESRLIQDLRRKLAGTLPILATLDLHANVSDSLAAAASALVSYRTYPHVDLRERGQEAALLLREALRRKAAPTCRVARRALLEGANDGSDRGETMQALLALARQLEQEDPDGLNLSINAGFADADIPFAGPTVTASGFLPPDRLQALAEEVMDELWRRRDEWTREFVSPADAARQAKAHAGDRPLILADYADNPGGGAYGDATNLLAALLEAGVANAAFGGLYDPEALATLAAAGLGAAVTLPLGGKTDPALGGGPLQLSGTVVHLGDGRFRFDGPMLAGRPADIGPTAVFRVGGVDILVIGNNLQAFDTALFRTQGIDPRAKRVVAVKSMNHFRAAFGPIAAGILVVDSGALCSPDRKRLTYKRLRRPIYPLDKVPDDGRL